MTTLFTPMQKELIEGYQIAAMRYGWRLGRTGLTEPDPLFQWDGDMPRIVAEISGEPRAEIDDDEFDLPGDEPPDPSDED